MKEDKPTTAKVKLLAPHTHAGEHYKKGDIITVNPQLKAWLTKHNIIKGEV